MHVECESMIQCNWRGINGTAGLGYWTHEPDGSLPLAQLERPIPWAPPQRATSRHTYIYLSSIFARPNLYKWVSDSWTVIAALLTTLTPSQLSEFSPTKLAAIKVQKPPTTYLAILVHFWHGIDQLPNGVSRARFTHMVGKIGLLQETSSGGPVDVVHSHGQSHRGSNSKRDIHHKFRLFGNVTVSVGRYDERPTGLLLCLLLLHR